MDGHTDARRQDRGDGVNMRWDGVGGEQTAHREGDERNEHGSLACSNSLLGRWGEDSQPPTPHKEPQKHPATSLKRHGTEVPLGSGRHNHCQPLAGDGQWVLPGLWDVTCIPADFKYDQRVHVRAGHLWTPPASEERAGNARGQGLKERGPCSLDCPSWRFHGYFLETDQTQGRQQGADHTATGRRIQGH